MNYTNSEKHDNILIFFIQDGSEKPDSLSFAAKMKPPPPLAPKPSKGRLSMISSSPPTSGPIKSGESTRCSIFLFPVFDWLDVHQPTNLVLLDWNIF